MSDSVGKISLDLEVKSDLGKQISSISGLIAKNLKASLDVGTKAAFDGMKKSANDGIKSVDSGLKTSLNRMKNNLKNTIKSAFDAAKNVKAPSIKFPKSEIPKPNPVNIPKANTKRGPPIDKEVLTTQIDSTARELDIVNAKIEQQRQKLAQLKESFNTTFNPNTKNKINEQILKTEGNISRLITKSDKLGFKLADLDSKLAELGNESGTAGKKLGLFSNSTSNTDKETRKLSNSIKNTTGNMNSYHMGITYTLRQMFKWMIILPAIVKGLKAMATGLYNNLMTNEQFANSLAQIKSNLLVAFTPIYYAILPAINALMSALATATQYIASFISAIFGKTYNQSKQATQSLINAKAAMGAYGESAKAAGKAAKDALGLASFDEINSLNSQNADDSNGGGGSSGAPELVTPSLDTNAVDSSMKSLVDRIKAYFNAFDFEPLIKSFNRLKTSVTPVIINIGKIIKWFFVEILDPLAHWTISDLIPAFLNLLAGALDFLNPILEVFMSLGKWLWDSFLQPIASWTGGIIVDVLNGLADTLSRIGVWISEHKPLVESLVIIIGSFAAAWKLVTVAMGAWNIVVGIWSSIGVIATTVTTAFSVAVAFLTNPINIAILAIGALIAIGVLLYKNWDTVKAFLIEAWNNIKEKASEIWTSLKNFFINSWNSIKENANVIWTSLKSFLDSLWNGIKNTFNYIWNSISNIALNIWTGIKNTCVNVFGGVFSYISSIWTNIKNIFSGVISFIKGVFTGNWTSAWDGVKNIFVGIMGGLGSVIKAPLNAVISLINSAIGGLNKISVDIPSWVPVFGGSHFGLSLPKIPFLAKGGIIDSPTLAMVGEAGKEAVMPLENNTGWIAELANQIASILGTSRNSINTEQQGGDIIFMIDGSVIGKVALKELRKMQRQGGITIIPT